MHERSLHSDAVWCGFTADFIIGLSFFDQNASQGPQRCSITGSRYCSLLQQYIILSLRQPQCLETTAFMQDGAVPHIARQVTALFRIHFGDESVFSRGFLTA